MRLTIRDTKSQVGNYVSVPHRSDYPLIFQIGDYIAKRINAFSPTENHPKFVLGLPTGSSPLPVYERLVELYKSQSVSFKVSLASETEIDVRML